MMRVPFSDLWPKRRVSAPRMTEAERAYRARVRENKRKAKKSSAQHQGLAKVLQHRV